MKYYNNLAKIRKKHNLSQNDIAQILGTTQQTINRYENGQVDMSVTRFIELADFYQISLDELAGRTQTQTQTQNQ